jgi:hypothetical protein
MTKNALFNCPECGCIFDPKFTGIVQPRSEKQHKAFFHMIRVALDAWPDGYTDFRPDGLTETARREHLRAWLLCKAGWRRLIGQPLEPNAGPEDQVRFWSTLLYAAQVEHVIAFPVYDEKTGRRYGVAPKSIAEGECDPVDFRQVFEEVKFLIEEITKVTIVFTPKHLRELREEWGFEPKKAP